MKIQKQLLTIAFILCITLVKAQSISITVNQQTLTIGDVVTATVIVQGGLQVTTLNWDDGQQTKAVVGTGNDTLVFTHKYTFPGTTNRTVTATNGQMQATDDIAIDYPQPSVRIIVDAPDTVQVFQPFNIHYYIDNCNPMISWHDGVVNTLTPTNSYTMQYAYSNVGIYSCFALEPGVDTFEFTIVVVDDLVQSSLQVINPMGGEIFQPGSTDTVVVNTSLNGDLYYTIHGPGSMGYFDFIANGISQVIYADGNIKKYLITWPTGVNTNLADCYIRCTVFNNDSIAGDNSNDFIITDNLIQGHVYADLNNNNIFDNNDVSYASPIAIGAPGAVYSQLGGGSGIYNLCGLPDTNITVTLANPPSYYTVQPLQHIVDMSNTNVATGYDFALQPISNVYDLKVDIIRSQNNVAIPTSAQVRVTNIGTIPSPTTTVTYSYNPSHITVTGTNPTGMLSTGNVEFTVPPLGPLQTEVFTVTGIITQAVGTIINESANTPLNDADLTNNGDENAFTCVGAYDPNAITASPGIIYTPNNINTGYIHYYVQFQNTGNGEAINIRVNDTIASNLDMNTFEILETSHPMNAIMRPDNVVDFMFPNIMLPDSNVNEPGSHGYFIYRIKPTGTLPLNTQVNAKVDIYFDYNDPITTNTTNTIVIEPLSVNENTLQQFTVYPNPANGVVYILPTTAYQNNKISVRIFSGDGRLILSENYIAGNSPHSLDVTAIPDGMYSIQVSSGKAISTKKLVLCN